MKALGMLLTASVLLLLLLSSGQRAALAAGPDWAIEDGWFYTQAAANTPNPDDGFAVTDRMSTVFGGQVARFGYPISNRYIDEVGRDCQAFQKAVIQLNPDGRVEYANIFDLLSIHGKDAWLQAFRSTPPSFNWDSDSGKFWGHSRYGGLPGSIEENHLKILDPYPALRDAYLSNPYWFEEYGLPMSVADNGNHIAARAQEQSYSCGRQKCPGLTLDKL